MRKINDDELIDCLKNGNMTQKQLAVRFQCSEAAISKRKKRYERLGIYNESKLPESFKKLGDKEQRFIVARLNSVNQTQAALQAFECGTYGSAKAKGSQIARRNDIKIAINELMRDRGLSRTMRIDRLKEHIENKDPNTSLKSIEIANKMEGLYGTNKHLHLQMTREDYEDSVRELADLDLEIKKLKRELGLDQEIIDIEPEEDD